MIRWELLCSFQTFTFLLYVIQTWNFVKYLQTLPSNEMSSKIHKTYDWVRHENWIKKPKILQKWWKSSIQSKKRLNTAIIHWDTVQNNSRHFRSMSGNSSKFDVSSMLLTSICMAAGRSLNQKTKRSAQSTETIARITFTGVNAFKTRSLQDVNISAEPLD